MGLPLVAAVIDSSSRMPSAGRAALPAHAQAQRSYAPGAMAFAPREMEAGIDALQRDMQRQDEP